MGLIVYLIELGPIGWLIVAVIAIVVISAIRKENQKQTDAKLFGEETNLGEETSQGGDDIPFVSDSYLQRSVKLGKQFIKLMRDIEKDEDAMDILTTHDALEPLDEGDLHWNFNQRLSILMIMDLTKGFHEVGFEITTDGITIIPLAECVQGIVHEDPVELDKYSWPRYHITLIPHIVNICKSFLSFNVMTPERFGKFNIIEVLNGAQRFDLSARFYRILTDILVLCSDGDQELSVTGAEHISDLKGRIKQLPARSNSSSTPTGGTKTTKTSDDKNGNKIDPMAELNSLIGLNSAKKEVVKLTNFIKIQRQRESAGLKCSPISYHCVFTGNPGTGKTTVARILAGIYADLGILKEGKLVETDRSGLVAEYVGQTAVKTNKIIDSALDGVLFIDEAYSLVQGGSNDYGLEAIATLLKRMEDDRDRLVVILAGYGDEMKEFIDSNPGLESRFNRYIHFEDYSADELHKIFNLNVAKHEYILSPEANERVLNVLKNDVANKDENFGNARHVRNIFEKTLENQATRLSEISSDSLDRQKLQEITAEDIPS